MPTSRPSVDDLARVVPALAALASDPVASGGLGPRDALERLPDRYFATYDTRTIARHVELLCSLSLDEPYGIDAKRIDARTLELTIVSIDDPGLLSLLAGLLGAAGLDITSGAIFTMSREAAGSQPARRWFDRPRAQRMLPTRRIVDRFVGTLPEGRSEHEFFAELSGNLDRIVPLILPGGNRDEARRRVNEAVADRLRHAPDTGADALLPLEISFEPDETATQMVITGEDTPFFLYALSAALTLQNISIESVSIETREHVISDVFELARQDGMPITGEQALNRLRFSVLLTKQFTYFLDRAPDPYAALVRFESMSRDLVEQTNDAGIGPLLSSPLVLRELAQLLGASDFLWEDFLRLQYENIIPMLTEPRELSSDRRRVEMLLRGIVQSDEPIEVRRRQMNEIKDREAFLADLDHILHPDLDFFFLSDRLSDLAELVVRAALDLAWEAATARYGVPRAVAGLESSWAVFGLGKLGGRAIGYASDIELLFVYRDSGTTDGGDSIPNAEFFERLFMDATGSIESKREGIFSVDLRLRPFGKDGPHAVSLESFIRYYGRDGEAHSYERLALTRLRAIAGSPEFGRQVEELRGALIYSADSIDLAQLRSLRERQFQEKARPGVQNAKFSPGALVDLEYGLQILLVQHGRTNPRLRTPSLHAGLEELERSGVMDADEASRLVRSYRFLRNLINGLRMLRGNAQDLYLPDVDSLEYAHLARRSGYKTAGELSAAEQLHVEFEARTAAVRAFLERHLGRESIPGERPGNAADLVLSSDLADNVTATILADAGLTDHRRGRANIASLAGEGESRELFAELVILVWQSLRRNIDPDMALNNWDRYVARVVDRREHYRSLLRQPRMLDLMLQVFASSAFLSETLIDEPSFLEWALDRRIVGGVRSAGEMRADLTHDGIERAGSAQRRKIIRRRRRREILRIGTRDICLKVPLPEVTAELSYLARTIVQLDLDAVWNELDAPAEVRDRFTIFAFGKLGGNELNYSSDVDLMAVYRDGESGGVDASIYSTALTRLRSDLSDHTVDGYAYRVDFRLRPYGTAGPLVQSIESVVRYYERFASPWEYQALMKLAPIAGNLELGDAFLERVKPTAIRTYASPQIRPLIGRMRAQAVRQTAHDDDIKSGEGGIRDIEFLVQGLQMVHSGGHPQILTGNTLDALGRLTSHGIVGSEEAAQLADDYTRLRRVEHFLQLFEDRQVHAIPHDAPSLAALARRLDGPDATGTDFLADLERRRTRTRAAFERFVDGRDSDDGL